MYGQGRIWVIDDLRNRLISIKPNYKYKKNEILIKVMLRNYDFSTIGFLFMNVC